RFLAGLRVAQSDAGTGSSSVLFGQLKAGGKGPLHLLLDSYNNAHPPPCYAPNPPNSRCTHQTMPIIAKSTEGVRTKRGCHAQWLSQVNTGSSMAMTTPWATSTPRLKPSRAMARFQEGKASGRRAEAKPKPCTRPKSKLTTQRCDGARWRARFSR